MLDGRQHERATLDRLLSAVPCGESATLVIEGEAGVGKSALLEYLHEQAHARGSRRSAARSRAVLGGEIVRPADVAEAVYRGTDPVPVATRYGVVSTNVPDLGSEMRPRVAHLLSEGLEKHWAERLARDRDTDLASPPAG